MRRAFSPVELAAFRTVKHAFDPAGLLNLGVMLPPAEGDEPDLRDFADAVAGALKDVAGLDAKRLVAGGRRAFGRAERVTLRAVPALS